MNEIELSGPVPFRLFKWSGLFVSALFLVMMTYAAVVPVASSPGGVADVSGLYLLLTSSLALYGLYSLRRGILLKRVVATPAGIRTAGEEVPWSRVRGLALSRMFATFTHEGGVIYTLKVGSWPPGDPLDQLLEWWGAAATLEEEGGLLGRRYYAVPREAA